MDSTEPVKRGRGRPKVEKTQRAERVYKVDESPGRAIRFVFSLSAADRAKISRVAKKNGVMDSEQVRRWIREATE